MARAAVSTGEGRHPDRGDDGLAYTTRLELLPLGAFTSGGDGLEGVLAGEPNAKLSIAVALTHNDRMRRTDGQLGTLLFEPRSATTRYADMMAR